MKKLRSFLLTQMSALIVGIVTTIGSLYLIYRLVQKGIVALNFNGMGGVQETFRGMPNPGGSTAFGLVFFPVIATCCWWGIISDWKSNKKNTENDSTNENDEA